MAVPQIKLRGNFPKHIDQLSLKYGENYINPPMGKVYLTIREARRKINEMKLIATAECKFTD